MSVALVMTVRDEQELLRTNLLYHRFMGVDLALVYDDGSADATVASVADLEFVRVRPTVALEEARAAPDLADLADLADAYERHFVARQLLNARHAMKVAAAAGADWLAVIDADELLAADPRSTAHGQISALLGAVASGTSVVVFPPLEVVQQRGGYDDVLMQARLFKRPETRAKRRIYDPFARTTREIGIVYGHHAGKSVVRVASSAVPVTSHRYVGPDGQRLATIKSGSLLHYYCHSFEAFAAKYRVMRDHPDRHLRGDKVVYQKRLWRDVVNRSGMSDDELRDYYERWVAYDPDEIQRLRARGLLRRVPSVIEYPSASKIVAQLPDRAPPRAVATGGSARAS